MGNGAEWVKKAHKKEMSPFGEQVADLLDTLYRGIYHIDGSGLKNVDWSNDHYIELMLIDHRCQNLSTYDFDVLTWLVLLSHDRCIRVSVEPGTFRNLKLIFHPRKRFEDGMSMSVGMPTMERHIDILRTRTI